MAIYSLIPAGCGLWDIGLQGKSKLGSLAWADAISVCWELNHENAAPANHANARQKTGPCEPGPGLGAADSVCGEPVA